MSNPVQELIQNAIDQNYNAANNSFTDIINTKISDTLDNERERLANQIYNGALQTSAEDDQVLDEPSETPESGEEYAVDTETEVSDEETEDEEDIEDEITDEEMNDALDELDDEDDEEEQEEE